MKRFLLVILAMLLTGCSLPGGLRPRAEIDWIDFFRWNGVTYAAEISQHGRPLVESDLGELFATVRFQVAGNVHDPSYKVKDGDAAFLAPGTQVYRVKGYGARFRVAARRDGQIVLYEADTIPAAKVGADLLDLEGKVSHIIIRSMVDHSPLAEIRDPAVVGELVSAVLKAPVFAEGARGGKETSSDNRYGITFVFRDGTATTRTYWPDSGFFWAGPGLKLPAAFGTALENALK